MTTETYRFGGTILLNGLPSPLSFSVLVPDLLVELGQVHKLSGLGVHAVLVAALRQVAEDGLLALRVQDVLQPQGQGVPQEPAEKFLKKVLEGALETARFSDQNTGRMTTETYRFGGTILLNGLPSPLSFSVTVRAADGVVTRFSRDVLEGQTIGGVPSAKPSFSRE